MTITVYLQALLSNTNILAGFLLCYFPMLGVLRKSKKQTLIIGLIFTLFYIAITSGLTVYTNLHMNYFLLPSFPILFLLYYRTLDTPFFKALSTFLVVISLVCFATLYSEVFSARIHDGLQYNEYNWPISVAAFLVSLSIPVLFFVPANRHFRWLVENYDYFELWKSAIFCSLIFILVTIIIVPRNHQVMTVDRFFYFYMIIITTLLFSMLYLYYLLYQEARRSLDIIALERHNHFLGFQAKEYHNLTEYMNTTRRLRHDFRQQLATIQQLAEHEEYDALKDYLAQYLSSSEVSYSTLCPNSAVNAIASFYKSTCTEHQIKTAWALNLPQELPIPEPEYCVMLGNLLENAIDASKSLPIEKRSISVISHMPTSSMLILLVENNHNTTIRSENHHFLSTKHSGKAIGLASIKETVDRYHGNLKIEHDNEHFSVNILLVLQD